MAERLVEKFPKAAVYDVSPKAAEAFQERGAAVVSSLAELAERADVIGICVRDDSDVRDVCLGDTGLFATTGKGTTLAVHSTVLPSTVTELAAQGKKQDVDVIDACVTGGPGGAAAGTLTYMVGGDESVVARCRPVFEASGSKIVHTGDVGTGAATKLCNNLMTYLGFLAAFEAYTLASNAGLSSSALEEVTRSNGNLTDQMAAFLALHKLPEEQAADADFQAAMKSYTTLAEKDLAVTLAFARENGVALPGTALCQQLMARVYGFRDSRRR